MYNNTFSNTNTFSSKKNSTQSVGIKSNHETMLAEQLYKKQKYSRTNLRDQLSAYGLDMSENVVKKGFGTRNNSQ